MERELRVARYLHGHIDEKFGRSISLSLHDNASLSFEHLRTTSPSEAPLARELYFAVSTLVCLSGFRKSNYKYSLEVTFSYEFDTNRLRNLRIHARRWSARL